MMGVGFFAEKILRVFHGLPYENGRFVYPPKGNFHSLPTIHCQVQGPEGGMVDR